MSDTSTNHDLHAGAPDAPGEIPSIEEQPAADGQNTASSSIEEEASANGHRSASSEEMIREEAHEVGSARVTRQLAQLTTDPTTQEDGAIEGTQAEAVVVEEKAEADGHIPPLADGEKDEANGHVLPPADREKAETDAPVLPTAHPAYPHFRRRLVSIALLLVLLAGVIAPLIVTAGYGIQAYATYRSLRAHATSGFQHLLNVRTIFSSAGGKPANMLDSSRLAHAGQEFAAARSDFAQVQDLLDHTPIIHTITQYLPQYSTQVTSARAASQIGIDIAEIGQQLTAAASIFAPRLHGALLTTAHTPLITSADIALIGTTIDAILPLMQDIETQSHSLSLASLPLSAHQRQQVASYLQLLPQAQKALQWGRAMLGAASWLLGVDQPRTFLVQTMDRSELRATGGFTGQYGELEISNGRIAPFSLHDISAIEYADNSPTTGNLAPEPYRSWWPFANWGLRDSNLSADFPTSAQLAIQQYQLETHHQVDGVILFTPFLIEHVLQITGPLQIPEYNETITAQNLEQRLHYYQLDNTAIRREETIEHVSDPSQARKLFTSRVAHVLMDRVRHASPGELASIGLLMLRDLETRDLQVYVTNAQLEGLLMQYGYAGQIDRSTTHDGLYVVQANVSASKASQYVRTIIHDTVTLDAHGGATHVMQLRLAYTQIGPVYGLDTYRDYVRVYVPPTAKFLWGDGFDTGEPLCGGPYAACAPDGIYPGGELVCPTGQYQAGASAPMIGDPYAGAWHPLDKIGPPNNFTSDEPGRAMFGGYLVVPKNCTLTATLSWYVPPMGNGPYDLLIQRQTATFPELDLSILPTPGDCAQLATSGLHFHGIMAGDMSFALKKGSASSSATSCYPHSGV
jgi:hypothetical protein